METMLNRRGNARAKGFLMASNKKLIYFYLALNRLYPFCNHQWNPCSLHFVYIDFKCYRNINVDYATKKRRRISGIDFVINYNQDSHKDLLFDAIYRYYQWMTFRQRYFGEYSGGLFFHPCSKKVRINHAYLSMHGAKHHPTHFSLAIQ